MTMRIRQMRRQACADITGAGLLHKRRWVSSWGWPQQGSNWCSKGYSHRIAEQIWFPSMVYWSSDKVRKPGRTTVHAGISVNKCQETGIETELAIGLFIMYLRQDLSLSPLPIAAEGLWAEFPHNTHEGRKGLLVMYTGLWQI